MNYSYTNFLFITGNGRARVTSFGNDASTITVLESRTALGNDLPMTATLDECSADLKISNVEF